VAFLLQPPETFGVLMDRPHVFLEDDLLRRGGTDDLGEPPEMGWAPRGLARIADVVSEQEGCAPKFGGLEIANSIFANSGEIPDGVSFPCGDIHWGKIPRARQAGQLHGVPAVGFDAVPGLFGHARRRHHPAVVVFLR
jgi:hypothetical protein